MAEHEIPLTGDEDMDDLPRTLRRERAAVSYTHLTLPTTLNSWCGGGWGGEVALRGARDLGGRGVEVLAVVPRTVGRDRAARDQAARERDASRSKRRGPKAPDLGAYIEPHYGADGYVDEDPYPAVVKQLDVPFLHMMVFFLKAVIAAIPALIVLGAIVWLSGEILQQFFPWLIKMRIIIQFPDI